MAKAELAEPLLQTSGSRDAFVKAETRLVVLRRGRSHHVVQNTEGDARFHLHTRSVHRLFGGLDWHVASAVGHPSNHLRVRRDFFSGETTFTTTHGDRTAAKMTHRLGQLYSDLHLGSSIYRWVMTGPCAPVQLRLLNTATGQCAAQLQASSFLPWSRKQQHITVLAVPEDALWLQVVVASGLAEAQRLGVGNSWTVPKRWAK